MSPPRAAETPFALVCGALCLLTGCTVLLPTQRLKHLLPLTHELLDDEYEDYVGVIHIHTTYSHDAHGKFEDVVRVANAQGLDYVMLTEHNTLQPLRDGLQGWHGATLILIGTELSTPGGHYLAFNITEEIDRERLTTQEAIDEVNRQGGFGFIAHPYFKKGRWKDWGVTGATGIEAYNAAHDTLDENRLRLLIWTLTVPPDWFYLSLIDRPYDPLRSWDTLIARQGRVTGIGSADAHEFHLAGLKFAPYSIMFQMVRTHLLIASAPLTPEDVYEALRQGHTYFAIELTAEAKGFSFFAERRNKVVGIMGDEVTFQPGLVLTAILPAPAELTLLRNGRVIAMTTGPTWQIPITEPGAYRLEAARHDSPWIFSNPIYVRAEEPGPGTESSTTVDVE